MKHVHRFLAVAALVMLAACAPAAEHARSGHAVERGTTLMVQNDNWSDVIIYLMRGSARTRIGHVIAMGKAEFELPAAYIVGISDVTLQAAPVGSNESYISPAIMVFPGSQVALTVGSALRLSNFAVYSAR
jgi:hypothetical protein